MLIIADFELEFRLIKLAGMRRTISVIIVSLLMLIYWTINEKVRESQG